MQELGGLDGWIVSFVPLLLAAFVSGAIVGLERERHGGPIGLRTCILVCVGATTYMASGHLIMEVAAGAGDPTRIASQIITGIGFLGAGAIIRGAGSVSGLTSAATIWFQGALGILIGCSYPVTGILLALIVVVLLAVVNRMESWVGRLVERRAGH
ncbi:MAG: MgtC/SapB family protein [Thermoanaerobaculia bacterium]